MLKSQAFKNGDIEVALNDTSDSDPQRYPKVKFHWSKDPIWVRTAAEAAALGGGWADRGDVFNQYRGIRDVRPEQQLPTRWLAEWSVPGLLPTLRKKIEAQLLKAAVTFDRAPEADVGALAAMRQAFDGISKVLLDGGILTRNLLTDIAEFVWDSAIAGGWWRLYSALPHSIFPEQMGRNWIWREDNPQALALFRAETLHWQAELLDTAASELTPTSRSVRRSPRYLAIDEALRGIAQARPRNHQQVFEYLDARKVNLPNRNPFKSLGWLRGSKEERRDASAWLSSRWKILGLPPFERGPKN